MSAFWWVLLIGVVIIAGALYRRLSKWWRDYRAYIRAEQERDRRWREQEARIAHLTLTQARDEAYQVLQDRSVFRLVPRTKPLAEDVLRQLPEDVAELARQYERIELVGTESEDYGSDGLRYDQIAPSELSEGALKIGHVFPATDAFAEIVVRPRQQGICQVWWTLGEPTYYPSVFHWILASYYSWRIYELTQGGEN